MLSGFLNIEGVAVPVVRLDELLGLPELTFRLHTSLIVLKHADLAIACPVDRVSDIVSASQDEFLPVAADHALNDCVEADVSIGDRRIHLLSPERLLLAEERERLAELQTMEQERLGELRPEA